EVAERHAADESHDHPQQKADQRDDGQGLRASFLDFVVEVRAPMLRATDEESTVHERRFAEESEGPNQRLPAADYRIPQPSQRANVWCRAWGRVGHCLREREQPPDTLGQPAAVHLEASRTEAVEEQLEKGDERAVPSCEPMGVEAHMGQNQGSLNIAVE